MFSKVHENVVCCKKTNKQTNKHFNLSFTVSQLFTGMINGIHTDPPSSIPKVRVRVR